MRGKFSIGSLLAVFALVMFFAAPALANEESTPITEIPTGGGDSVTSGPWGGGGSSGGGDPGGGGTGGSHGGNKTAPNPNINPTPPTPPEPNISVLERLRDRLIGIWSGLLKPFN